MNLNEKMNDVIIIRYAEIALKGKNRIYFEKQLINDIKDRLKRFNINAKVIAKRGRIYVKDFDDALPILELLSYVPGIKSYSLAIEVDKNIEAIIDGVKEVIKRNDLRRAKIIVNRADKSFPLISPEIVKKVVEAYKLKSEKGNKINFEFDKNAEKSIEIDIQFSNGYVFVERYEGLGGLPLGSGGKALLMLSGGMDSPVAGVLSIKRGLLVDAIYFDVRNDPTYTRGIMNIFNALKQYNPKMKLYIIPYYKYHIYAYEQLKKLGKLSYLKYGCLICRRGMFYLSIKLAKEKGYKAIVTGENLGQVASQTLSNLITVTPDFLILRPLITYDKDEIQRLANRFKLSNVINLQSKSKCIILPKFPATKSRKDLLEKIEKEINAKEFLDLIFREIKQIK